jgi:hypothetical protein
MFDIRKIQILHLGSLCDCTVQLCTTAIKERLRTQKIHFTFTTYHDMNHMYEVSVTNLQYEYTDGGLFYA